MFGKINKKLSFEPYWIVLAVGLTIPLGVTLLVKSFTEVSEGKSVKLEKRRAYLEAHNCVVADLQRGSPLYRCDKAGKPRYLSYSELLDEVDAPD